MDDGIDSVIERSVGAAQQGLDVHSSGIFSTSPPRSPLARKRSMHLTLVLVSAAALTACGGLEGDKNMSRDAYANLEACKADWGAAGDCETVKPGTGGSTHGFYGPRYYSRSGTSGNSGFNSAPRPGSNAVGTVSGATSRGGFGASSAHHSGGSSHSSGS